MIQINTDPYTSSQSVIKHSYSHLSQNNMFFRLICFHHVAQGSVTEATCCTVAFRDRPKTSEALRFWIAELMAQISPRELVPPKPAKDPQDLAWYGRGWKVDSLVKSLYREGALQKTRTNFFAACAKMDVAICGNVASQDGQETVSAAVLERALVMLEFALLYCDLNLLGTSHDFKCL